VQIGGNMEDECKMVSIRMDAALREKIDDISKETGITITHIIKKGVEMFIREHEEKKRILAGATQFQAG
jgi:predicted DNA-binding protein